MRYFFRILILMITVLTAITVQAQSPLATLANSMQPGTWAELTTNNFNSGAVLRPPRNGSLLEFSDKAGSWNPVNKTIMVLGGSHSTGGTGFSTLFARYTESANDWVNTLPNPVPNFDNAFPVEQGIGHDYHHDTIVPTTGDYYHRQYYSGKVMKFSHASQTWSQCSEFNVQWHTYQVAGALEYFPDRNSLVYLDGDWGVWELSLAGGDCTGVWLQRASTNGGGFTPQLTGLSAYHNQSRYSVACHCILMTGQQTTPKMYRFMSDGTFNTASTPPIKLGIPQAGSGAIFTSDPVTGNILVWNSGDGATTMYEYNATSNIWAAISRPSPIFPGPEGGVAETIAVPISTYGVILFVQAGSSSGGKVYLYKHSSGSVIPPVDTTAPSDPSNVTALPVSPTEIIISWAASTDNIGVAGYRLERCTGAACSNFAQIAAPTGLIYSDTSLVMTTTYRYRLRAVDAAGNLSGYSIIVTGTTQTETIPPSSDFTTRCAAVGVVKCISFDSQADITGTWGVNSQGVLPKPSGNSPAIDIGLKASGAGSMRMTVPAGSTGGVVGDFFANFSNDYSTQFGENTDFYIQWRQRFDVGYVTSTQSTGMKQAIIGTGSTAGTPQSSCSNLEFVTQNTNTKSVPQWYQNCGRYEPLTVGPVASQYATYDFELQNALPVSPGCWNYAPDLAHRVPPLGNCIPYAVDEWMTFQVHIHPGPLSGGYFTNSHMDVWIAREGQTSVQVLNFGPYNIGPIGNTEKYGQIWFLTYSGGGIYPVTSSTWYDDLIISRNKIADPDTTVLPPANQAPVVSAGIDQTITLPSKAVLIGTATDDGLPAPAGLTYQWTGPAGVVFASPEAVSTTAAFTSPGSYILTLTVSDGLLTSSDAMAVQVNAAPPTDPCIIDPLKITGVKWPVAQTGSRSISYNSGTRKVTQVLFDWPGTLTITDDRNCTAVVNKN